MGKLLNCQRNSEEKEIKLKEKIKLDQKSRKENPKKERHTINSITHQESTKNNSMLLLIYKEK